MRTKDAQAEKFLEQNLMGKSELAFSYVAPKSDKYKAELIHKETGEVGSILRDSLENCVRWAEKCRSEKFATRITGADIYHYNSFFKKDLDK
jgi:hypothetical protein